MKVSETLPLNKWPLEKLLMMQIIVDTCIENKFIPEKENWKNSIQEINDTMKMAIEDQKNELSQLPFNY